MPRIVEICASPTTRKMPLIVRRQPTAARTSLPLLAASHATSTLSIPALLLSADRRATSALSAPGHTLAQAASMRPAGRPGPEPACVRRGRRGVQAAPAGLFRHRPAPPAIGDPRVFERGHRLDREKRIDRGIPAACHAVRDEAQRRRPADRLDEVACRAVSPRRTSARPGRADIRSAAAAGPGQCSAAA